MPNADEQLFKHAAQVAESRIRSARLQQSQEAAKAMRKVFVWLAHNFKAVVAFRATYSGLAK